MLGGHKTDKRLKKQSIQEGVLAGHPDLAGKLADASLLTPESTRWDSSNSNVLAYFLTSLRTSESTMWDSNSFTLFFLAALAALYLLMGLTT